MKKERKKKRRKEEIIITFYTYARYAQTLPLLLRCILWVSNFSSLFPRCMFQKFQLYTFDFNYMSFLLPFVLKLPYYGLSMIFTVFIFKTTFFLPQIVFSSSSTMRKLSSIQWMANIKMICLQEITISSIIVPLFRTFLQ